eukprot:scaffold2910_cov112-Isochrysis_galbana.AAC.3
MDRPRGHIALHTRGCRGERRASHHWSATQLPAPRGVRRAKGGIGRLVALNTWNTNSTDSPPRCHVALNLRKPRLPTALGLSGAIWCGSLAVTRPPYAL